GALRRAGPGVHGADAALAAGAAGQRRGLGAALVRHRLALDGLRAALGAAGAGAGRPGPGRGRDLPARLREAAGAAAAGLRGGGRMGPGLRLRGARRELAGGARRWRRSLGRKGKSRPRAASLPSSTRPSWPGVVGGTGFEPVTPTMSR